MASKLIPFNCYVHPNHKKAFQKEAKAKGITVADVVRSLAGPLLKKHGLSVPAQAVVKSAKKAKVVKAKGRKAVVAKGKKPKITSGRIQKILQRRKNESMADYVARLQAAVKSVPKRRARKATDPEPTNAPVLNATPIPPPLVVEPAPAVEVHGDIPVNAEAPLATAAD